VSSDPADYMYGPTGNQTSRTNGGTNRSGGVSVVEVDEECTTTQTAPPARASPARPRPATNTSTQQQQQSTESGSDHPRPAPPRPADPPHPPGWGGSC
jgi:hypothetical protein